VFRHHRQARIPLLVGSTADDGGAASVMTLDGSLSDTFIKLYPDAGVDTVRRLNTDAQAWRVWTWAQMQSLVGERRVYLFNFARAAPDDAPAPNRAYHGAEVFYVFHNLHLFAQRWADWDRQLEETMSSYWVNFASSGNPNGGKLPRWPAYTTAQRYRVMMLGDKVEVGPSRLDAAKIALFDAQYNRLLSK
jgi:para-nitrobenzyl esterase